jgi:hypothetical protein
MMMMIIVIVIDGISTATSAACGICPVLLDFCPSSPLLSSISPTQCDPYQNKCKTIEKPVARGLFRSTEDSLSQLTSSTSVPF